jgi:ankyrin repeat protein
MTALIVQVWHMGDQNFKHRLNYHITAIKALISLGANLNIKDQDNNTALMIACKKCNYDLIDILIDAGADTIDCAEIMIENRTSNDPRYIEAFKKLITKGAFKDTLLIKAIDYNRLDLVDVLLKSNINVNATYPGSGRTVLMIAIERGYTELVCKLISVGADIDAKDRHGTTPLMISINHNRHGIFKKLIDLMADLDSQDTDGRTALIFAAEYNLNEYALYLIKAGAKLNLVNEGLKNALMIAIENNSYETAMRLISSGIDLNVQDSQKRTALMHAIMNRSNDIVYKLINSECNLDLQDSGGYTALMYVYEYYKNHEYENFMTLLINSGANLDIQNIYGDTILMKTLNYSNYSSAKIIYDLVIKIIDLGADVNLQTENGDTALKYAVKGGRTYIVYKLIKAGANVNVIDNSGETVLFVTNCYYHNILQNLFASGINVHVRNRNLENALFKAQNRFDIAILLMKGCDPYIKNLNDKTVYDHFRSFDTNQHLIDTKYTEIKMILERYMILPNMIRSFNKKGRGSLTRDIYLIIEDMLHGSNLSKYWNSSTFNDILSCKTLTDPMTGS